MQGVRRVVGGSIPDDSYDDSTLEGGRNTTVIEHPGHGGWASEFQNDFPGEGRPAELPVGGMPRPGGDDDGNAGALPEPACLQHRGHYVGVKPHPPTVRPMQHAGPLAGTERQSHYHVPV